MGCQLSWSSDVKVVGTHFNFDNANDNDRDHPLIRNTVVVLS